MTPIDRAAIREALAKATPGKWYVDNEGCVYADDPCGVVLEPEQGSTTNIGKPDAHLIANAPAWLAGLLEALEATERDRDGVYDQSAMGAVRREAQQEERDLFNDRIAALEAQVAAKDEALRAAKSQLTQYWAYLSSDRVEDAAAILDAALALKPAGEGE